MKKVVYFPTKKALKEGLSTEGFQKETGHFLSDIEHKNLIAMCFEAGWQCRNNSGYKINGGYAEDFKKLLKQIYESQSSIPNLV